MNQITSPCFCGCGQPVPQPPTGRSKKYLDDSHKAAHFRRNKTSLKSIQSTTPTTPTSTSKQPLIGSDGKDYSDPHKSTPPHIAPYMPVQSHQSKTDLLALEARIHGRSTPSQIPSDKDCAF